MNNIEFPIFILAIVSNLALGIVVLQYAAKNISRYFFLLFVISQVLWFTVNYLSFNLSGNAFLWAVRLTLFFAGFHAFFFFLLIYTFLEKKLVLSKKILIPITVGLIIVSGLTLSPLIFNQVRVDATGDLAPTVGQAIPIFGLFVAVCVLMAFYFLIRKYKNAVGIERDQWRHLTYGLSLTFFFVLVFSFIIFIVFEDSSTVKFGHIYTLPFIIFTAYAMVKDKLLDIKALVAEVAVILLNLILVVQIFTLKTPSQIIFNIFVLIGTMVTGLMLVKGVRKEVRQREQLEILTNQLKNANEKLKILDQARADFITIASHQLRTPPATIKWYLSSILDGDYGKMDSTVHEQLRRTMSTNNSMISLIDDLLNASRIERGKMEFIFQPTDFLEITKITVDQLLPQAEIKKLKLTFEKPKEILPVITADKEKLRQVINNLIDNAIKYTQQGTVAVSLSKTAKDLVFKVSDSGKGVTSNQIKGIFEKYDRGKSAPRNSTGLGLGLYVAKVIVQQHKGKIWVESKGEGKGSTFIFTVPIKSNLSKSEFDLTKGQEPKKPRA